MSDLSEILKFKTTSPLQEQLAKIGVCPSCKTKRIVKRYENEEFIAKQCTKCMNIFILMNDDTNDPNNNIPE